MKFLGDMGISQSSINWLRQNAYDAIHLREEGLHRITDALEKGAIISVEEARHRVRVLPI